MVQIQGLKKVQKRLRKIALETKADASDPVVVGYSQNYAIYVHERTELQHKEGKQAKFLEEPARTKDKEIARAIVETYKKRKIKKGAYKRALLVGGLRLQRESQKIVPIDTGALRASAFTVFESQLAQAESEAQKRADEKRAAALKRREEQRKKRRSMRKKKRRRKRKR